MANKKILAFSRYDDLGPSSRLRMLQYEPYLDEHGYELVHEPLFSNTYLDQLFNKDKKSWVEIAKGYLNRMLNCLHTSRYEMVWLEKELFPMLPAFFEKRIKVPLIVDYDDAVFHNYDLNGNLLFRKLLGDKIDKVMSAADCVIAGNSYLGDRARRVGAENIEIIPTVVDLDRYKDCSSDSSNLKKEKDVIIGWIGSPSTAKYLEKVIEPLKKLQQKYSVGIVIVGADTVVLPGLDYITLTWSESREVELIDSLDIGIMPLDDTPWSRGKCGYKLIQYMACGKAVVASPVGMNTEIVDEGVNGYLSETNEEWYNHLEKLIVNDTSRHEMGNKGFQKVEQKYQLEVTAPQILDIFNQFTQN